MRLKPAVFLDRDGVINHERKDYVKSWEEFSFQPGSLEAFRRLREAGQEAYVITNQSGVGRGILSLRTLLGIHLRMELEVQKAGGMIHGIVFCPHHPDDGCKCRKPATGMFQMAAVKYGLDLSQSVFVGDAARDVQAGKAAGCKTILVRTHISFERFREELGQSRTLPDFEAANLLEAAEIILR